MKRKYVIGSSILIIGMITSGLAASLAWFVAGENTFKADVNGSVVEEYFHCGSGSIDDPFVITRPMHYYHLVEFFQRKTVLPTSRGSVTFGTDYLYFQIGYNLDNNASNGLEVYAYNNDGSYADSYGKTLNMAYFSGDNALMPIGTSECPFFGSFDGGGNSDSAKSITVQNLHIRCSEEVIVQGGSSKTTRYTSDVGMFGYVADADGSSNATSIHNLFVDTLTIDLTGAELNKTTSSGVSHTSTHPDKVYVGYIVGHMHTYTNYDESGPTNASPLYNIYVNNAKILGGFDGAICNFGYVGYADTIDTIPGSEYYLADKIAELEAAAEESGDDNTWGGTFDSKSYVDWFYDLYVNNSYDSWTKPSTNNARLVKTVSGDGGYKVDYTVLASTSKNPPTPYDPSTKQLMYRFRDGSFVPLKFTNDNKTQTDMGNSGYLVGSNVGTGVNASPKVASYKMVNIGNALTNTQYTNLKTAYDAANISYVDSKLEILTYKDGWKRIQDSHNENNNSTNGQITSYTKTPVDDLGLVKYNKSRNALQEILTGTSMIHGIHFDNNAVSTSSLLTVSANTIRINNSKIATTYQLPKGSIDFNVAEDGYINFYAGTFNSSDVNLNFFSLYQVTRNASGNITALTQIKKIYSSTSGSGYVYQTGNSKPSGADELLFDVETVLHANAPVKNMMYYFEIPANAGEYAMGVAGSTQGAYMIYLDLAANGSHGESEGGDLIAEEPIFTQMEYLSSGYVINSCFNIGFVVPDDSTKNNFYVMVSRSGDVFNVTVVNTTGHNVTIYILLVDDDTSVDDYPYSYTLTYNGGSTSSAYTTSAVWEGASGGTTLENQTS